MWLSYNCVCLALCFQFVLAKDKWTWNLFILLFYLENKLWKYYIVYSIIGAIVGTGPLAYVIHYDLSGPTVICYFCGGLLITACACFSVYVFIALKFCKHKSTILNSQLYRELPGGGKCFTVYCILQFLAGIMLVIQVTSWTYTVMLFSCAIFATGMYLMIYSHEKGKFYISS